MWVFHILHIYLNLIWPTRTIFEMAKKLRSSGENTNTWKKNRWPDTLDRALTCPILETMRSKRKHRFSMYFHFIRLFLFWVRCWRIVVRFVLHGYNVYGYSIIQSIHSVCFVFRLFYFGFLWLFAFVSNIKRRTQERNERKKIAVG